MSRIALRDVHSTFGVTSMPDPLSRAQAEIRAVLARAPTMHEARHAEDTLAWLLRLRPGAGPALALAALGHDLDHADPRTALAPDGFETYGDFKDAHAACAARLLRTLLTRSNVSANVVQRACWLVEHHESGGDADADLLRDADHLSWFRVNLPGHYDREGPAETLRRCRWSYDCLSPCARQFVGEISHRDPRLNRLLRETMLEKRA